MKCNFFIIFPHLVGAERRTKETISLNGADGHRAWFAGTCSVICVEELQETCLCLAIANFKIQSTFEASQYESSDSGSM